MTPLDRACPHIDRHGLHCGAEKGDPCVEIDQRGDWHEIRAYHDERILELDPGPHTLSSLTPAERKMLRMVIAGLSHSEMAEQTHLAINTIKRHVTNINEKLGTHDMRGMTVWYFSVYWQPKRV